MVTDAGHIMPHKMVISVQCRVLCFFFKTGISHTNKFHTRLATLTLVYDLCTYLPLELNIFVNCIKD